LSFDNNTYLRELQERFGWRAGRFVRAGARASYPLKLTRAATTVAARTVLIGNAAQALHPVAGQGFNLGLRDAAMLAEVVVRAGSGVSRRAGADQGPGAWAAASAGTGPDASLGALADAGTSVNARERAGANRGLSAGANTDANGGSSAGVRDGAASGAHVGADVGSPELLRQFAAWREGDRSGVVRFTDGLVKMFADTRPGAAALRNIGLLLFDLSPPAKSALARVSAGFAGPTPRLARGLGLL
jgi:2-octaprenyl-6-methoxyphenol hydroxylase